MGLEDRILEDKRRVDFVTSQREVSSKPYEATGVGRIIQLSDAVNQLRQLSAATFRGSVLQESPRINIVKYIQSDGNYPSTENAVLAEVCLRRPYSDFSSALQRVGRSDYEQRVGVISAGLPNGTCFLFAYYSTSDSEWDPDKFYGIKGSDQSYAYSQFYRVLHESDPVQVDPDEHSTDGIFPPYVELLEDQLFQVYKLGLSNYCSPDHASNPNCRETKFLYIGPNPKIIGARRDYQFSSEPITPAEIKRYLNQKKASLEREKSNRAFWYRRLSLY